MTSPGPGIRDAPPADRAAGTPRALVVVWALLVLPATLWLVLAVGQAVGNAGTAYGPPMLVQALVTGAAMSAAVAMTAATRVARARAARAVLALLTTLLLLAMAAPVPLGLAAALTEEWCESQPGGRGWTSYVDEDSVPAVCR